MTRISRRTLLAAGSLVAAAITTRVASGATADAATPPAEIPGKKKIIVTGGHPGDPEYGCGGTIARLAAQGHEVTLLYLNRGDPTETPSDTRAFPRVAEATRACEILQARPVFARQIDGKAVVDAAHQESFRQLLAAEKPDVVWTHWPIDNHSDHRAMSLLVYDGFVHFKKSFALYYYEVSNGEDTVQFAPTEYLNITSVEAVKRRACFAHASQSPERYYPLQELIARMRGTESGYRYAEAFIHHVQSPRFPLPRD